MKLLRIIDDILNELTMYRLLVYGLSLLAAVSIALSVIGTLPLVAGGLIISLVIVVLVSYITNKVLARIWHAVPNQESWLITALILFFILPPASTLAKALSIGVAAVIAISSKYIGAINNKHFFNPAAVAAVSVGILGILHATWWVGSSSLWPYALVFGLVVLRKIQRFRLFFSFVIASLIVTIVPMLSRGQNILPLMQITLLASPLIFLGTIMLTEPATMPPKPRQQLLFGALVGVLYSLHTQIAGFYIYPETALVIANVYAYIVSPKRGWNLVLQRVDVMSDRVHNYVFTSNRPIPHRPGQYLEWTLPGVALDGRGNRRTFTIASSPTEKEVMFGVKFYEPSSAFKRTLQTMQVGDHMVAGHLAGNFCLPRDPAQKLLFIAGGIGITPFRSMLQYLVDSGEKRDIVLLYLVSDAREVSYQDVLRAAVSQGVKVVPVLSGTPPEGWNAPTGRLSSELLEQYVDDIAQRRVYISGPPAVVTQAQQLVAAQGVAARDIVTDDFSGY